MSARALAGGVALAALAALFAGCGVIKHAVDPKTAQLERFKELGAARQHAAIAGQEVRCTDADKTCRQLHLIKGDACFELARRGDAPTKRYECAIVELASGFDGRLGRETALGSSRLLAEKLLEALRARRDLSASAAESAPYARRLVENARIFRTVYPDQPAGYYYEAGGRYGQLLDRLAAGTEPEAMCAELAAILVLLQDGAPPAGRYSANFERISRDVQGTVQAECDT